MTRPEFIFIAGASRGIGEGFARALAARDGVRTLFLASRSGGERDVDPALTRAATANGVELVTVPLDITAPETIAAAATRIGEHTDRLDWIVNTVGLLHDGDRLQPERRLEEVDAGNLLRSFSVNSIGPLLLVRDLARFLPRRDPCTVATLSARVGSIGDNRLGGWYAYRASKAAQNMLTKTMSIELARRHRGIRCVALHPGTVETALSEPFRGNVSEEQLFSVERSVAHLLDVMDQLDENDNGKFFAWDGKPIPW